MTKLAQLQIGERAIVKKILGLPKPYRAKLRAMGLHEGASLTVQQRSIFGDPIAVSINDTVIALRAQEAENIELEKCS